ncbi:ketoacyl-ACP synthase III [Leptospira kmetyi]|uniref:ketoacyl-ACP synthase III n=1 Tax=Leptospira kmetyi TaxID=408139 RepID=UPI001FCC3DA0|nr:ketoacyl-ACP synthase III [Leptospira kmetyi]
MGVNERRRANEKETPMFMAAKVAEMALKDAGKKPEDVDLYILANWTDRYYLPDLAPQASKLSGTKNALAFDVSTACTGFVHGVQTASAYLGTGKFKNALVIGSERFSVRTRMGGYGEFTAGDAAAGVFLEHTGDQNFGIIDSFLQDDGDLAGIIVTGPPPASYVKSYPELVTNAADLTLKSMDLLLEKNGLTIDDIDWVVPHPGTDVVVQDVLKRTKFPREKILMNFERVGNTSAASIPIVLSEYYYKGKFKKGDLFLTPAVGGGFYWGGLLFRL